MALVVFRRFLALFPTGDAGSYPFVFQRFPEPVGVGATAAKQPVDFRQAAQHCPRADLVTDLTGGNEQIKRTPLAVADGVQLGIHTALGAPNQASTPPFLTPKLEAVRCALRHVASVITVVSSTWAEARPTII